MADDSAQTASRGRRESGASGGSSQWRFSAASLCLTAILAAAVALRLYGLDWGLPDRWHLFSLHPDESVMMTVSLPQFGGLDLASGRFLPHYYNYGSLPFYLTNIAVLFANGYHLIGPIVTARGIDTPSFAAALLVARCVTVVMGVGTVWAVYAIGRRLWSPAAGLIAALLLAVTPLHVQQSHFATVDVGTVFWQMLSIVWAAKLLRQPSVGADESSRRVWMRQAAGYAALAGLFAGLTAATKYSGALVLLCVWAAVAARRLGVRASLALMVIAGLSAAAAFVVGCPAIILDTARMIQGIAYESAHVMHHGEIYFQQTGPGWFYIVSRNLDAGMGLPLLIAAIGAAVYAVVRRRPEDAILAAFALPYYLITGMAESRYARYEIPLLPILALWIGRIIIDFAVFLRPKRAARGALASAAALLAVFTLVDACVLIAPMGRTDTRELAAAWLNRNYPAPAKIGFGQFPWFWTATIDPEFGLPRPLAWTELAAPAERARYCYDSRRPLDPDIVFAARPPVITLSEYEYYDALRLRQPQALRFVEMLSSGYKAPVVFGDPRPIGAARSIDGLPIQDLPTDMLYARPTILIFVRQ